MTAVRTESRLLIAFRGLNGFTAQGTRVSDSDRADTLDDFFALAAGTIEDAGAHLATGWHEHYWEPLKKYLA